MTVLATMNIVKFFGWVLFGLIILAGLAYGALPYLVTTVVTQQLTQRGLANVVVQVSYPTAHLLQIPMVSFTTPEQSGSSSIAIRDTQIKYSLDSLINNAVDSVTIAHMRIDWNASLPYSPSPQSPSDPPEDQKSPVDLSFLRAPLKLPLLPFRHIQIKEMRISNPSAPFSLQEIALSVKLNLIQDGYEGHIHIEESRLPLNHSTFSIHRDGRVLLTAINTSSNDAPPLHLETALHNDSNTPKLRGQARLTLQPLIQTLEVLYPIPKDYRALTGTFSATWSCVFDKNPSSSGEILEALEGTFSLTAQMPKWSSFTKDIQLVTEGSFSIVDRVTTIVLKPTSSGSVKVALDSQIPPALSPFIPHSGLRTLTWKIHEPVHLTVPVTLRFEAVLIPKGTMHITLNNASEQLESQVSPIDVRWEPPNIVNGNAEVSLSAQLRPAPTLTFDADLLTLDTTIGIALSAQNITLALRPQTKFAVTKFRNQHAKIPLLEGRFSDGLTANYQPTDNTWKLQANALGLALPTLFIQDQRWKLGQISTKDLSIHSRNNKWTITGTTQIAGVEAPPFSIKIPASNWDARYSISSDAISLDYKGQTVKHPIFIKGRANVRLADQVINGTLNLQPLHFAPKIRTLSQLIQPWPFPDSDITHGSLSASVNMTIRKNPTAAPTPFEITHFHGILDVDKIGGVMLPTMLKGFTTQVEILGKNGIFQIPPTPIRIQRIRSVVDLTNTVFLLSSGTFQQTSPPKLSVTNVSTHLLGGELTLQQAIYDSTNLSQDLALQARGLDLDKILRLEQQETVTGTGILDGDLPLVIDGSEIEIHGGFLKARPPGGILQMNLSEATANQWTENQPNLNLVVQSLENFHYSQLDVGVDYEKNGILTLTTKLKGENPHFRGGVPIHFNLNIEENVPALLQSLSLVQDLEDKIETMMTGSKPSKPQSHQ